jgi:hypothetical protein
MGFFEYQIALETNKDKHPTALRSFKIAYYFRGVNTICQKNDEREH